MPTLKSAPLLIFSSLLYISFLKIYKLSSNKFIPSQISSAELPFMVLKSN